MASSAELYRSSSVELPEREALIKACKEEYEKKNRQTNNFLWPNDREPRFFVKFGVGIDPSEAQNQIHFHKITAGSTVIRVPEVYWVFHECTTGMTYIVMEYIQSHGDVSHIEMGRALVELLSVPPPEGAAPGPIGGGKLHHALFRHGIATSVFEDNRALGEYITRAAKALDRNQQVHFAEDDLAMYYTDICEANFLKDESNRICPVDFEQAGVAPSAFMAIVLKSSKHAELADLVLPRLDRIRKVTQPTLECMGIASYVHQMGSFK